MFFLNIFIISNSVECTTKIENCLAPISSSKDFNENDVDYNSITRATHINRYPAQLEYFKNKILPDMLKTKRISICVIGTSKGDEMASFALAIMDGLQKLHSSLDSVEVDLFGIEMYPGLAKYAENQLKQNQLTESDSDKVKMQTFINHSNVSINVFEGDIVHPERFSETLQTKLKHAGLLSINNVFQYISPPYRKGKNDDTIAVKSLIDINCPIITSDYKKIEKVTTSLSTNIALDAYILKNPKKYIYYDIKIIDKIEPQDYLDSPFSFFVFTHEKLLESEHLPADVSV